MSKILTGEYMLVAVQNFNELLIALAEAYGEGDMGPNLEKAWEGFDFSVLPEHLQRNMGGNT